MYSIVFYPHVLTSLPSLPFISVAFNATSHIGSSFLSYQMEITTIEQTMET